MRGRFHESEPYRIVERPPRRIPDLPRAVLPSPRKRGEVRRVRGEAR
jgi:hypothetical protein